MKRSFLMASLMATLATAAYSGNALAYYSGTAVLDPSGTNASATDLASVDCYDNGNGAPHHFSAAVQDMSPSASGLWVSLHILKDSQMTTVTDHASGDGGWSQIATVNGGPGTYYMSVRKTAAGSRNFLVGWECQTINNVGTGTDLKVLQFQ